MPQPAPTNKRPSAQEIFTDRETHIEKAKTVLRPFEGDNPRNEHFLTVFYGVGGIGKTTLCEKILAGATQTAPSAKTIRINLDSDEWNNPRFVSLIALLFGELCEVGIQPRRTAFLLQDFGLASGGENLLFGRIIDAADVAAQCGGIPFLGFAIRSIQGIFDKVSQDKIRHILAEQDLLPVRGGDEKDFNKKIANALYRDLIEWADESGNHLRILIDGFERIQSQGHKGCLDCQELFQDLLGYLALDKSIQSRVRFLIFGRNKLAWDSLYNDSDWQEHWTQHLLEGLSEEDAKSFIGKVCEFREKTGCGDLANAIRDNTAKILDATDEKVGSEKSFLPYYLDLAVEAVERWFYRGEDRGDLNLGAAPSQLTERFLKYLGDNEARIIKVLVLAKEFDADLFDFGVGKGLFVGVKGGFSDWIGKGHSFITAEDPARKTRRFHRNMEEGVNERWLESPDTRRDGQTVADHLLDYLAEKLPSGNYQWDEASCRAWMRGMEILIAQGPEIGLYDFPDWKAKLQEAPWSSPPPIMGMDHLAFLRRAFSAQFERAAKTPAGNNADTIEALKFLADACAAVEPASRESLGLRARREIDVEGSREIRDSLAKVALSPERRFLFCLGMLWKLATSDISEDALKRELGEWMEVVSKIPAAEREWSEWIDERVVGLVVSRVAKYLGHSAAIPPFLTFQEGHLTEAGKLLERNPSCRDSTDPTWREDATDEERAWRILSAAARRFRDGESAADLATWAAQFRSVLRRLNHHPETGFAATLDFFTGNQGSLDDFVARAEMEKYYYWHAKYIESLAALLLDAGAIDAAIRIAGCTNSIGKASRILILSATGREGEAADELLQQATAETMDEGEEERSASRKPRGNKEESVLSRESFNAEMERIRESNFTFSSDKPEQFADLATRAHRSNLAGCPEEAIQAALDTAGDDDHYVTRTLARIARSALEVEANELARIAVQSGIAKAKDTEGLCDLICELRNRIDEFPEIGHSEQWRHFCEDLDRNLLHRPVDAPLECRELDSSHPGFSHLVADVLNSLLAMGDMARAQTLVEIIPLEANNRCCPAGHVLHLLPHLMDEIECADGNSSRGILLSMEKRLSQLQPNQVISDHISCLLWLAEIHRRGGDWEGFERALSAAKRLAWCAADRHGGNTRARLEVYKKLRGYGRSKEALEMTSIEWMGRWDPEEIDMRFLADLMRDDPAAVGNAFPWSDLIAAGLKGLDAGRSKNSHEAMIRDHGVVSFLAAWAAVERGEHLDELLQCCAKMADNPAAAEACMIKLAEREVWPECHVLKIVQTASQLNCSFKIIAQILNQTAREGHL